MGIDTLSFYWDGDTGLTGSDLLVLLTLADIAHMADLQDPDLDRIAVRCSMTTEEVAETFNFLITCGYIERHKKTNSHCEFSYSLVEYRDHLAATWQPAPRGYTKRVISKEVRRTIFERDGWRCVHCGASDNLCCDHIIPERLGGSDDPDNLQTLCRSCNSKKGLKVKAVAA